MLCCPLHPAYLAPTLTLLYSFQFTKPTCLSSQVHTVVLFLCLWLPLYPLPWQRSWDLHVISLLSQESVACFLEVWWLWDCRCVVDIITVTKYLVEAAWERRKFHLSSCFRVISHHGREVRTAGVGWSMEMGACGCSSHHITSIARKKTELREKQRLGWKPQGSPCQGPSSSRKFSPPEGFTASHCSITSWRPNVQTQEPLPAVERGKQECFEEDWILTNRVNSEFLGEF